MHVTLQHKVEIDGGSIELKTLDKWEYGLEVKLYINIAENRRPK